MLKHAAAICLLLGALGCERAGEPPAATATSRFAAASSRVLAAAQELNDKIVQGERPRLRPQTPRRPFPYAEREVRFVNRTDRSRIAGTLTVPSRAGPHPALLLISGSGSQDRDETIFGHKPFLVLPDKLTRDGFVVLRVDDRGVGASTGDPSRATIQLHATDAAAGVEFLRRQPEVDADRIGLIGHSEGGIIAPMVASRYGGIAFIVSLAGPGVAGYELSPMQVESVLQAHAGFPSEAVQELVEAQRKIVMVIKRDGDEVAIRAAVLEGLAVGNKFAPQQHQLTREQLDAKAAVGSKAVALPWFRSFIKTDPRALWRAVRCPVLAINGDKDTQVQADANLAAIGKALQAAGNEDVTLKKLTGLNHLFQTATTGLVEEYDGIEQTFDAAALELISAWLVERAFAR